MKYVENTNPLLTRDEDSQRRRDVESESATAHDFSVVVPAFNEEDNVDILLREIVTAFDEFELDGEIILVDDGSTDSTFEKALPYKGRYPFLKVVRHPLNLGKTEAILTAADLSESPILVVLDADLQYSPREIPRFLEKIREGYDIVTGRKVGNYEKRGISYIYNALCRKLFNVPIRDMNSMKSFRKEILDELTLRHDGHRFFVALACQLGYSVTEIDVTLYPRERGQAKYSGYGRILVGIMDLLAVKFKVTFAQKPLLFFGSIGFAMMALGALVGLVAIYLRFALQQGFRPLLYLVMLFVLMGITFLIGGFLGELIGDLSDRLEKSSRIEKKHARCGRLLK